MRNHVLKGHTELLSVPMIAAFTKCDALYAIAFAFGKLREEGVGMAASVAHSHYSIPNVLTGCKLLDL